VLARLAAKYHYEKIGQGRLTIEALIAMSAGRLGIRVITAKQTRTSGVTRKTILMVSRPISIR
jgi:hypothetical protein